MHFRILLSMAMSLAPAVHAATGPLFDYCTTNSLDSSTIIAECTNGEARIDLNNAIANNDGQLVWDPNGGYFSSCASNAKTGGTCDLDYATLACDCIRNDGTIARPQLGLSKHLWYDTDNNTLFFEGELSGT